MRPLLFCLVFVFLCVAFTHGSAIRDLKSDLIAKGNESVKKANEVIKKLKTSKKDAEATVIGNNAQLVEKLAHILEAAKTTAEIDHLETEMRSAESKLTLTIHTILEQELLEKKMKRLLQRINGLKNSIENAIKNLKELKMNVEAVNMEKNREPVIKLINNLKVAKTLDDINKVENEFLQIEKKLNLNLQKVADLAYTEKYKANLLTRAIPAEQQAKEALLKLKAEGKNTEVALIEKEEGVIRKLIEKLQVVKLVGEMKKLEEELSHAIYVLEAELRRIN